MAYTPLEALNKVVEDRVAKVRLTGFRTLANLADMGRVRTWRRTNFDWDADIGPASTAWESMLNNGASTAIGTTVPANLKIGQYRLKHQFDISRVAITEAANIAPADLADLFGTYTDRALNAIFRQLNIAIWQGDGTSTWGGMIGLTKVLDPTYAYAGIDPSIYPLWKSITLSNGGTGRAFSRQLMLNLDQAVQENEAMYNMVITTPSVATTYVTAFDTIAGSYSTVNPTQDNTGKISVDLGHGGRYYNGYPLVEDYLATLGGSNGHITMMDANSVWVNLFDLSKGPDSPNMGDRLIVNESYGIPVHIAELPSSNSAVRTFEFFVLPQLQVINRKMVQSIKDLNVNTVTIS